MFCVVFSFSFIFPTIVFFFFFFNDTATTEIYTLSLHDALPIFLGLFLCPTRRFFCDTGHHERCRPLHARFLANRLETSVPKQRLSMSSFGRFSRVVTRSEEHTSELQSRLHLVCRLLLEKKQILPSSPSVVSYIA